MNNNDATMPLDSTPVDGTISQQQPRKNPGHSAAATAAATAAAGVATGAGAYAAYTHITDPGTEPDETIVDPVEDITDPAATATTGSHSGTGNHTGSTIVDPVTPPVEPVNPPVRPVEPPVEPVEPPVRPIDPPVEPVDPPVRPVDPPVEPVEPVEPVNPPAEPIEPQIDVVENPDDIADAIIAGEEIDPDDFDADGQFTFTEVETVYDIEGNETTEARYIDIDGRTGTMVDIDGDGLFDQWRPDDGGIIVPTNEGSFLTVTDAETDAKEGYLAYDDSHDDPADDSYLDDIIDTSDLA